MKQFTRRNSQKSITENGAQQVQGNRLSTDPYAFEVEEEEQAGKNREISIGRKSTQQEKPVTRKASAEQALEVPVAEQQFKSHHLENRKPSPTKKSQNTAAAARKPTLAANKAAPGQLAPKFPPSAADSTQHSKGRPVAGCHTATAVVPARGAGQQKTAAAGTVGAADKAAPANNRGTAAAQRAGSGGARLRSEKTAAARTAPPAAATAVATAADKAQAVRVVEQQPTTTAGTTRTADKAASGHSKGTAAAHRAVSGGASRSRSAPAGSGGNKRAAGSGGSLKRPEAAANTKRPRTTTQSDTAPGNSSQDPPGSAKAAAAAAAAGRGEGATRRASSPGSGVTGAVTLPTPRRRSRLGSSGGLLSAAAAAAAGEVRPAQTVMEAQERGEQVQMQDDARYAMDGLVPTCSMDTQRDSAATLTDMLSSRKGRAALRADGLAQQFLTNLAKLKAGKDCVLALSATLSLLMLAAEDANPCYLASVAAAVLMDQLLQSDYTLDDIAASGAAGSKLCRLTRGRALSTILASTGVNSTRGLLLIALEQATSSQQASKAAAVEKVKHNLRQHGGLQRMAALVADASSAPAGAVAAARQLHLLLLVLENATFTCPENGSALVDLVVTPGAKSSSKSGSKQQQKQQDAAAAATGQAAVPFPSVLVSLAQQLLQGLDEEAARTALHVALSVLMNLSHQNPAGAALISSAGGMEVAADTILRLLQPAQESHDALCQAVLEHLELLSVALGVLINLVSGEPQHSRRLAAGAAAAGGGSQQSQLQSQSQPDDDECSLSSSNLVALLCAVMSAVSQLLQQQEEEEAAQEQQQLAAAAVGSAGGAAGATLVTSPSAAVASGAMGSSTGGEASIVEVYCGMLLGFLVRDCEAALAQNVASMLEGNSLQPITSAVQRCLSFYIRTGAITDHTRSTLEELLQHLAAAEADRAAATAGKLGQPDKSQSRDDPEAMEIC